jgi:hypothetical protein
MRRLILTAKLSPFLLLSLICAGGRAFLLGDPAHFDNSCNSVVGIRREPTHSTEWLVGLLGLVMVVMNMTGGAVFCCLLRLMVYMKSGTKQQQRHRQQQQDVNAQKKHITAVWLWEFWLFANHLPPRQSEQGRNQSAVAATC